MSLAPIAVGDGKYTFSIPEGDYRIHALRHGEPWLVISEGSKALFCALSELADARELIAAVTAWGGYEGITPKAGQHGELHAAIVKYRSVRGLPQVRG